MLRNTEQILMRGLRKDPGAVVGLLEGPAEGCAQKHSGLDWHLMIGFIFCLHLCAFPTLFHPGAQPHCSLC